ncbi:hypothetical protein Taro_042047, partial [Colocasia esculenta]|nr:hypothetical protein [Colocasia esculenta]
MNNPPPRSLPATWVFGLVGVARLARPAGVDHLGCPLVWPARLPAPRLRVAQVGITDGRWRYPSAAAPNSGEALGSYVLVILLRTALEENDGTPDIKLAQDHPSLMPSSTTSTPPSRRAIIPFSVCVRRLSLSEGGLRYSGQGPITRHVQMAGVSILLLGPLLYPQLIEPLVQVLRMVDGEDKNDMDYLYEAMDKAKERLREKHPQTYQKWWRIIDARWESTLHHDLHAAGYFFNPRHQYSDSPHNDGEVLQGTINVIGRLSRSMDERIDAMIEMDRFKLKLDIYRDYDVKEAVTRMGPSEWWVMLDYKTGQRSPLARIAIRVLSQTTSSSQCERNWSTFSLIHTKVRNRL